METSQKIVPHLWFDNNAEEAVKIYTSLFDDSKIMGITKYGEAGEKVSGMKKGTVMTIHFKIFGQEFIALNGGPVFGFTPAISFLVKCKDQEEIDRLWGKLSVSKEDEQCGWLKDKFGLSWQIVPDFLYEMLLDKDEHKVENVMAELLKMKKIDIKKLRLAYAKEK